MPYEPQRAFQAERRAPLPQAQFDNLAMEPWSAPARQPEPCHFDTSECRHPPGPPPLGLDIMQWNNHWDSDAAAGGSWPAVQHFGTEQDLDYAPEPELLALGDGAQDHCGGQYTTVVKYAKADAIGARPKRVVEHVPVPRALVPGHAMETDGSTTTIQRLLAEAQPTETQVNNRP